MGITALPEHNPHLIAAVLQEQLRSIYRERAPLITAKFSGPQVDAYQVRLTNTLRIEDLERHARTLGISAGAATASVYVTPDGDIELHVARPEYARTVLLPGFVEAGLRARYGDALAPSPFAAPLGIDMSGRAVWLNLADETFAHILLSGTTGTGKSVLGRWLMYRLLSQTPPEQLRWIAADPKKRDPKDGLFFFRRSAHLLHPIVDTTAEVVALLEWVLLEIDRRKATGDREPRIVVMLEEVHFFSDESRRVIDLLSSIMKISRTYCITVIATVQKPTVEALGNALANFRFHASGIVTRSNSTAASTGRGKTNADKLLGKGDLVGLYPGDVTVRFQAPFAGPEQYTRIPNVPKGQPVPRLLLTAPPPGALPPNIERRGGTPPRAFTEAERREAARLLNAGRGIDAVRKALNCGTAQAKRLAEELTAPPAPRVFANDRHNYKGGA